jgi:hypothetical protein
MLSLEAPNPRMRQQSDQQPVSKRQKVNYPRDSRATAAFWDNLSTIWLTKNALRELDRRNAEAAASNHRRHSLQKPFSRPVSRLDVAEWKANQLQPATEYLTGCTQKRAGEIRSLARHGGPDLSDLRGVRPAP